MSDRCPKAVKSGPSWPHTKLDMGRGLASGCCLGLVGQPEKSRGSSEAAPGAWLKTGPEAGPEAQGHSERPNKDPASSQTGNNLFGLEMAAVWSQEVGQEARRSLIGVLKEMRWKEAGSSAQAFGREGRGCLGWWTWGEVQAFPSIL